jgi:hypothetical protein
MTLTHSECGAGGPVCVDPLHQMLLSTLLCVTDLAVKSKGSRVVTQKNLPLSPAILSPVSVCRCHAGPLTQSRAWNGGWKFRVLHGSILNLYTHTLRRAPQESIAFIVGRNSEKGSMTVEHLHSIHCS